MRMCLLQIEQTFFFLLQKILLLYMFCNITDFKHFIVALMMVNTEKFWLIFETVVLFHLSLTSIWQIY